MDFSKACEQYPYVSACRNMVRYKNLTKKDIKTILKLLILDPSCYITITEHRACWSEELIFKFLKGLK
jgi:hypothetical protein